MRPRLVSGTRRRLSSLRARTLSRRILGALPKRLALERLPSRLLARTLGSLPQHAVPRAASRRRLEIALRRSRCGRRSPLAAGGPNSGRRRSPTGRVATAKPVGDGADFVRRQRRDRLPVKEKGARRRRFHFAGCAVSLRRGRQPGEPCSDRRTRGRRSRQAASPKSKAPARPEAGSRATRRCRSNFLHRESH